MPAKGWLVDLGANNGLFSVWAAVAGAQVVAVEAQQGFASLIQTLSEHNRVADRVHVEIAVAGGVVTTGAKVGAVADDLRWATSSHAAAARPRDMNMEQLISKYRIRRINLLKIDIEGGEYALMAADEDLGWLSKVDQIALELHPDHGDTTALIDRLQQLGFDVDLRDNDGNRADLSDGRADYAYCRRAA